MTYSSNLVSPKIATLPLNLIFNIKIYYKNIDECNFDNKINDIINYFKNIKNFNANEKYETIKELQMYFDKYNKKTFPTTLPNQYLESGTNNKYSNNISYLINDFQVISDKNINAMVVDKIKNDFKKDQFYFYNAKKQ